MLYLFGVKMFLSVLGRLPHKVSLTPLDDPTSQVPRLFMSADGVISKLWDREVVELRKLFPDLGSWEIGDLPGKFIIQDKILIMDFFPGGSRFWLIYV